MAKSLAVLIMGSGRMGEALARIMSESHVVTLYDLDAEKGRQAAARVGCRFGTPPDIMVATDAVVLALPSEAVAPGLASIKEHLHPGVVIINIATSVFKESLAPVLGGAAHLVSAKIIGQFMELKERPVVLIDADSVRGREVAGRLFSCVGEVQDGDEHLVKAINTIGTREAFRAAIRIERQLKELGAAQEMINSAIRVVAPGNIKAYASKNMGHFALRLLDELREEEELDRLGSVMKG